MVSKMKALMAVAALGLGALAAADFDGPAPVAWRWVGNTSVAPGGAPVIDGDTVYMAVGGRIYGVEKETGNLKWRYPTGAALENNFRSGAIMSGDHILAAADNNVLYAVRKDTGALSWQANSTDPIIGTPAVAGSVAVVPLSTGSIEAFNMSDGAPAWSNPLRVASRLNANIAAWENLVVVGTGSNKLMGIDAVSGEVRWEQSLARLSTVTKPVVRDSTIYLLSGGYVVALRAASGRIRWQRNTSTQLVFSPAVSDDYIAAVSARGDLFAFNSSGRPIFGRGVDLQSTPVAGPSITGSLITVPTANGSIFGVEPLTGSIVWNYVIPSLNKKESSSSDNGGSGGGTGRPGGGFAPGGAGAGGMDGGAGGMDGGGGQDSSSDDAPDYVQAASAGVSDGETLLVLARDGSLIAFDKRFGVDLTPPIARMAWPRPGSQISPTPPAEFVFLLEDYSSGINEEMIEVKVNGQPYSFRYERGGIVRVQITRGGTNRALRPGRAVFSITATDWMGNKSTTEFAVNVSSALSRPLGGPPSSGGDTGNQGGGGRLGGGGIGG